MNPKPKFGHGQKYFRKNGIFFVAVPSSFLGAKKEGEKKEESSALDVALIRRATAVVGDRYNYCASSYTSLASLLRDLLSSQELRMHGHGIVNASCIMY